MGEWIPIELKGKQLAKLEKKEDFRVRVLVSPYDVPEALRSQYDETRKRFIIEFRYVGDEEWKHVPYDPNVTLRVGVNSQRLYGIELNVESLTAKEVRLDIEVRKEVKNALNHLADNPPSSSSASNYELAKTAVYDSDDELFVSVPRTASKP
jgi:hypothetical protein